MKKVWTEQEREEYTDAMLAIVNRYKIISLSIAIVGMACGIVGLVIAIF